jgi:hypothetical protein
MQQLQRDLGRVEAKVEIMSDDIKTVKADLAEIKEALSGHKAVKAYNWKALSLVGLVASFANVVIGWIKPFFSGV